MTRAQQYNARGEHRESMPFPACVLVVNEFQTFVLQASILVLGSGYSPFIKCMLPKSCFLVFEQSCEMLPKP